MNYYLIHYTNIILDKDILNYVHDIGCVFTFHRPKLKQDIQCNLAELKYGCVRFCDNNLDPEMVQIDPVILNNPINTPINNLTLP